MAKAVRSGFGSDANTLLERWTEVLGHLPSAALLARASDGRVIFANDAARSILREDGQAGVAGSFALRWGFHADGRPYGVDEWPLARALRLGETIRGEEIELIRSDGSRTLVSMSANPLDDDGGERVAAVATWTDLGRQRTLEIARYFLAEARELLFAAKGYALTLDTIVRLVVPRLGDCCEIDVVDGHKMRRAASRQVDSSGSLVATRAAQPPSSATERAFSAAIAAGATIIISENRDSVVDEAERRRILGDLGAKTAMIVPLIARGRMLGALLVGSTDPEREFGAEDISLAEEFAALAALAMDNARLSDDSQSAHRAKADFLSVVSHELRTPLTAVIGYSELLALGIPEPVTERQAEQISRIEVSARQLLQLIEEILTVVSLDAGTVTICPQKVRLGDLVERAEEITEPLATEKQLSLEVSISNPDLVVATDPERLLQVINCLLSNAVKFTEEGSIQFSVRETRDSIEFVVRDSGIGLGEDERRRIFDAFWQVERPITRRVGGTGLGLAICRKLLDLLEGEVEVTSQPGLGSTFIARIPRR